MQGCTAGGRGKKYFSLAALDALAFSVKQGCGILVDFVKVGEEEEEEEEEEDFMCFSS